MKNLILTITVLTLGNFLHSNISWGSLPPLHFNGKIESKISSNLEYDLTIYFNKHTNPEVSFFLRIYNIKGLHIDDYEFKPDNWLDLIIIELSNDEGGVYQDRIIEVVDFEIDGIKYEDLKGDEITTSETFYEDISEGYYFGGFSTTKPKNHIEYKIEVRNNIKKCRLKFIEKVEYEKELNELLDSFDF